MAFVRVNFGPLGGQSKKGKAPATWGYKTDDAAAAVDTADYFLDVIALLSIGDLIWRVTVTNLGASNEALSTAGWHVVKDKTATSIDVTDATAATLTDTD